MIEKDTSIEDTNLSKSGDLSSASQRHAGCTQNSLSRLGEG
jgi:hypothetical protein